MEALNINGLPLTPIFSLGMTTNDKNWISILQSLKLQEGESIFIQSVSHTAAISKKNGQYLVYDPNYASGFKKYSTEKKLIHELHQNVFHYNKGPGRDHE